MTARGSSRSVWPDAFFLFQISCNVRRETLPVRWACSYSQVHRLASPGLLRKAGAQVVIHPPPVRISLPQSLVTARNPLRAKFALQFLVVRRGNGVRRSTPFQVDDTPPESMLPYIWLGDTSEASIFVRPDEWLYPSYELISTTAKDHQSVEFHRVRASAFSTTKIQR